MAQGAQDQLMTVADVISAMGISRSTWQKLVAQKQTPPIVRIGAVQRTSALPVGAASVLR